MFRYNLDMQQEKIKRGKVKGRDSNENLLEGDKTFDAGGL